VTLRRASAAFLLLALASACAADDGGGNRADRTREPSEPVTTTADGLAVRVEAGPESVLTAVVTVEADHPVPALTRAPLRVGPGACGTIRP